MNRTQRKSGKQQQVKDGILKTEFKITGPINTQEEDAAYETGVQSTDSGQV